MKKTPIGSLAFAVVGLLAAANPSSAQTTFFAAKGLQSNGFERDATVASVGKYGEGNNPAFQKNFRNSVTLRPHP